MLLALKKSVMEAWDGHRTIYESLGPNPWDGHGGYDFHSVLAKEQLNGSRYSSIPSHYPKRHPDVSWLKYQILHRFHGCCQGHRFKARG